MLTTICTERLVVHCGKSIVDLDEITRSMLRWFDDPAFDSEKPVLWDLRTATIELGSQNLEQWAEQNLTLVGARRAGRKTAFVFGDTTQAAAAVEVLGGYPWQNKVRIFSNDYGAAASWLTSTIK